MTTIQAPDRNLVKEITSATSSVVSAPSPLIAKLRHQPFFTLRRRHQWRTIPPCERVNDMKTPTAYRLMRLVVSPWKMTSSRLDSAARQTMPIENARRSPRKAN